MKKKVNILGTTYKIKRVAYDKDPDLKDNGWAGYHDGLDNTIVIGIITTYPQFESEDEERAEISENQTLRHEIVHAFLYQSGLENDAGTYNASWAHNEEMVDWIALQGPKIYKAWQEAEAL